MEVSRKRACASKRSNGLVFARDSEPENRCVVM